MTRELLHIEEVAVMLRRPLETVRRWRRTGEGPPMFRLGGRVMAYRDEVERWVEEQSQKPQAS